MIKIQHGRKDLQKLDRNTVQRIVRALHGLTEDPSTQVKKLKGRPSGHMVYTFRIGLRYRAILSVHDLVLIIHILEIENRKQAQRDF